LNGYLLRRKLATEKAPEESNDAPLPRHPRLLLDGEVPLDEAASGRVPQPGPSQPDGSFDPHRGRGLWGAHSPERSDAMKPSSSHTPPSTPPMPWPFQYPHRLPPQPWAALKDGERLDLPLIGGWVGQALFQAGYTISHGSSIGANDHRFIGASRTGNSAYIKLGPFKLGLTRQPDGVDWWASISLPRFLRRTPKGFQGSARPTLTFTLKPRGRWGWNSVLNIRYEDAYRFQVPDVGSVQGTSGVFVDISIQRVLVTAGAAYGLYRLFMLAGAPNPTLLPKTVP